MLHRVLIAFSFALSLAIATTGHAHAAFDPNRDELIGIMAAVVGITLAALSLVYLLKSTMGWNRQDPDNQDLRDYLESHH